MKKFLLIILTLICLASYSQAKQILPAKIKENTIIITAKKTGDLAKNYFYCSNGDKCSTEQVV